MDQIQDQIQDQIPRPGLAPDWSQDRPPRILYLRYTGFKGLSLPSDNLSSGRPRIGYARLVRLRNVPNHSTIPDLQERYNPRSYLRTATNPGLK